MKSNLCTLALLIFAACFAAGCGDSGGVIRPLPKGVGSESPHRHGSPAPSATRPAQGGV
jgi:hypothetical protein